MSHGPVPAPDERSEEVRVVWSQDRRSVGELLRDADHLARAILFDVDGDDAPGMLRTWGEVVQAASDLWQSLPEPGYATAGRRDAEILPRLHTHAQRMHRGQLRAGWPGDGPADEPLMRIAETFTRASELIDRYHRRVSRPGVQAAVNADVAAARTRILHCLHVTSHGVVVAVRQHVDDEMRQTRGLRDQRATRAIPRGREAQRRLEVFERLAGAYVAGRFVHDVPGEHQPPVAGVERLEAALVRWDIHAHRTLAYHPAPANLALAATTQAYIATAAAVVLRAGAATGSVSTATLERGAPALEASQVAWADMSARWRQLTDPSTRHADPDLLAAAGEVRAAVLEITHDSAAVASPSAIATRVNIPDVAHCLQQALTAAVDLAHHQQEVTRGTAITVPARTALTAYMRTAASPPDDASARTRGGPDELVSPVDPKALLTNAAVPTPNRLRANLQAAAQRTRSTAGTAMSATSTLDLSAVATRSEGLYPEDRRHLTGLPGCPTAARTILG